MKQDIKWHETCKNDVGEYLDHENCNCRKNLVDKLVEEYT